MPVGRQSWNNPPLCGRAPAAQFCWNKWRPLLITVDIWSCIVYNDINSPVFIKNASFSPSLSWSYVLRKILIKYNPEVNQFHQFSHVKWQCCTSKSLSKGFTISTTVSMYWENCEPTCEQDILGEKEDSLSCTVRNEIDGSSSYIIRAHLFYKWVELPGTT